MDTVDILLNKLRPLIAVDRDEHPCVVFLSATDMKQRAITCHAVSETADNAFLAAASLLSDTIHCIPSIVRADWVIQRESLTWSNFCSRVENTRRNYFRFGLALDDAWTLAFTEMELNANAMLYQAGNNRNGKINENNCKVYCKKRFGCVWPDISLDQRVWIFTTNAVFIEKDGEPTFCTGHGLDTGRRDVPKHTPALFLKLAKQSASYLARQNQPDGRFVYGYFSCFDKFIPTYNTLRHISSTWSLVDAYGEFLDKDLNTVIKRSITYCINTFFRTKGDAGYFEDVESGELKLGSNGCMLILLARYTEITKTKRYLPLMKAVAMGILSMQESDGSFVHILESKTFSVKEKHRIVYYDGEAVFGLLRFYAVTKKQLFLDAARHAFDYFIANEHWKNHDHWLSYAVNEMTRWEPEERFFVFGIKNFNDYLDFIAERETAYPTLLELMLAADEMLRRIEKLPHMRHLLAMVNRTQFKKALKKRADLLLNAYFWPEFAMFFKNPEKIVNSFFIKHHAFRVRIDDVQHFLSGFIKYAHWIERNQSNSFYRTDFPKTALCATPGKCWEADQMAEVTGGRWITKPPKDWYTSSVISNMGYLPLVPRPSVFVASISRHCARHLRIKEKVSWDSHILLQKNWKDFAGAIVERPLSDVPETFPQLLVQDSLQSLIELGIAARRRFEGTVIGVTGSVGKTTVCEMLHHVLAFSGSVFATYGSHNNKIGVPSVFASIPKEAKYAVLEMSIPSFDMLGGSVSTYLLPHIALITHISEAHLDQWNSLETIARMKSRIFEGMQPNGYAILNRDIPFFDIFYKAALQQKLTCLTYGTHESADIRLLSFTAEAMCFVHKEKKYSVHLSYPGKHSAMNLCGVAGVLSALGLEIDRYLDAMGSFTPLKGRGRVLQCEFKGKKFTVIDESYNASPASMRASLESMALTKTPSDVIILGEMRALGEDAPRYHLDLAESISSLNPSFVFLVGSLMEPLWKKIEKKCKGQWFPDLKTFMENLDSCIRNGDRILIKASNGTELWKVVEKLSEQS